MKDIKQLSITDEKYPEILRQIPDPPKLLYYRGNLDALMVRPAIAVVGTRRCSEYGAKATEDIVAGLAKTGVAVVSGMARGIDTYAHKTALKYSATTIAVLGTGIDDASIYPQTNKKLAHDIINAGGLIMSEYESDSPGHRGQFPQRNRIVAGLSDGVLAVEAPVKSGTLITTRLAEKYGKNVYAVPGSIFSRLSEGTNEVLAKGAKCARSADDILEDLEINYKIDLEWSAPNLGNLSAEELKIFNVITDASEPVHVDKIIQSTKLSSIAVFQATASLMMQDLIREAEDSHYIAVK